MSTKDSVLRGPKVTVAKARNLLRTMTTGTQVASIPKGSRIQMFVLRGIASNAGTTATVSIGNTATATQFVSGADVKTAAAGVGPTILAGVSGALGTVLAVDTPIFFKYAETGGASSAGNWIVDIVYTTGNLINDDTI